MAQKQHAYPGGWACDTVWRYAAALQISSISWVRGGGNLLYKVSEKLMKI